MTNAAHGRFQKRCWACTALLNANGTCPHCDKPQKLSERLASLRPGLPCCEAGTGACTGGSHCWHDEPDNIPEGYS